MDGDSIYPEGAMNNIISPILTIEFSVYPNPTQDFIYFENIPDGTTIKLFDLAGRQLINTLKDGESLDISNLSNGYYTITVNTLDGKIGVKKILKQ
jgi:hypothetical protein